MAGGERHKVAFWSLHVEEVSFLDRELRHQLLRRVSAAREFVGRVLEEHLDESLLGAQVLGSSVGQSDFVVWAQLLARLILVAACPAQH